MAMDWERLGTGLLGLVAVGMGVHAILTQRVGFRRDEDDGDDTDRWYYGWRAVATGGMFLIVGVVSVLVAARWSGLPTWLRWLHL